jgi:hypothetical protein
MSEIKRGALQSPADTARTTDTIVRHTQVIGADGNPMPSGASASTPIHVSTGGPIASTVNDGRKTVSSVGSAEALAASTTIKEVTITAELNNTGTITVGGSTVIDATATRRGTPLYPGDTVTVTTDNLAEVYIDTEVNGDGVTYNYLA